MATMNCTFDGHVINIEHQDGFRPYWTPKPTWSRTQYAFANSENVQFLGSGNRELIVAVILTDPADESAVRSRLSTFMGLIGASPLQRTLSDYYGESWSDVTLMEISNVQITLNALPAICRAQFHFFRPNT